MNFRAQSTFKIKIPARHFLHIHFLSKKKNLSSYVPPRNSSTKKSHNIFLSYQNPKSCETSKLPKNFKNQFLKGSKSSGQSYVPPRNSSTRNLRNIFLSDQNPQSCGTSKLRKNFENQFLKSPKSSGQSSVPPGIVLQKSPITFFSQIEIQKAMTLHSYQKILKINF